MLSETIKKKLLQTDNHNRQSEVLASDLLTRWRLHKERKSVRERCKGRTGEKGNESICYSVPVTR